jgi:hypothetical protein
MGLTGAPLIRVSKCTCGPVLWPVLPDAPITWPWLTDCPTETPMLFWCP